MFAQIEKNIVPFKLRTPLHGSHFVLPLLGLAETLAIDTEVRRGGEVG